MLSVFLMACGNEASSTSNTDKTVETSTDAGGNESVEKLTIGFVPSRNPDEIITATEPLKGLLKDELAKLGFDVEEIDITVGTNFEAVGKPYPQVLPILA